MYNSIGRLRRKVTFAITSFKKGSGLVFEGGSAYTVNWEIFIISNFRWKNFRVEKLTRKFYNIAFVIA